MNDAHMQFGIEQAKRAKEQREKANMKPAESTSTNESTTRESETRNHEDIIETEVSIAIKNIEEDKFSIFQAYNSLLKNHPFIVNTVQSAGMTMRQFISLFDCIQIIWLTFIFEVLQALGVIISQAVSFGNPKALLVDFNWIDWLEVKVMVTITLVLITPTLLWFYGVLERAKLSVVVAVVVDQFIFSPLFTAAIISSRLYLYNSVKLGDIWPQLSPILPNALVSGWCFWIPARFLILSLFPPDFHLPVSSIFALLWNVVFAMILSAKK